MKAESNFVAGGSVLKLEVQVTGPLSFIVCLPFQVFSSYKLNCLVKFSPSQRAHVLSYLFFVFFFLFRDLVPKKSLSEKARQKY